MSIEPPQPRPYGASNEEAIQLCRDWMIYLGAIDTVAASGAATRICDLYSARYLGWVDNSRGNLDVDVVERAASVAVADGRRALIFVAGGVRPIARQRADVLGVALLWFDAQSASLNGGNTCGRQLQGSGLVSR